ncbi:MAG: hypothetical protein EPO35_12720 [Acidobacteria bacterium]|nr:MAG: hypothetical protein EPO35_12720 [Acidobacteriota bacterium]
MRRASWWQWPTVLSIDAPVVAVLWQRLLARPAGVSIEWGETAVLALSVWLAYAADRWIEGWRLDAEVIRTPRHHFYQRHRWPVAALWLAALAADVTIAFSRLSARDIAAGFVLIVAVAAYLLSHQLVHRHRAWRLPKELCVAALLTGGVVVFLVGRGDAGALVMPAAWFALLGFANCALISVWEREVDRAHGQSSLALNAEGSERLIRQLPWMIAVLAAASAVPAAGGGRDVSVTVAASAVLLAVVDAVERRIGRQPARVLADVALMTPIVTLVMR